MLKDWEKIGTHTKRFQNMYGKKGKSTVIWIDNWSIGNYAIMLGDEIGKNFTYKEKETLTNVRTKYEAIKEIKAYMRKN